MGIEGIAALTRTMPTAHHLPVFQQQHLQLLLHLLLHLFLKAFLTELIILPKDAATANHW